MADAKSPSLERIEIDGGPTVLILPVDGTSRVAVQAMYDVGFIDEPRGIAQASHLIEHLACFGATAKSSAGESIRVLNQIGMANAETLPSLTHYDYSVPAGRLEIALETEAERLRSLKFEPTTIAEEAERCYAEVRFVAERSNPPALGKFSLMAATQFWRHSLTDASVLGGLETASLDALRAFHKAHYNRSNLTLIVAGAVTRAAVEPIVKKAFSSLPSSQARPAPIDWATTPKRGVVRWDASATIVYVAYPPPNDPAERLVVTAALQAATMNLAADPEVKKLAAGVDGSGMAWPVGRTPSFASFTLQPGTDPDKAAAVLSTRLESEISGMLPSTLVPVVTMLADTSLPLDATSLKAYSDQLMQQAGSLELAHDMILGNVAIQIGMRDVWLGPDRAAIAERARSLLQGDWKAFVGRVLPVGRRIVTVLLAP
jgi:predicted Zn-dependent peptidase